MPASEPEVPPTQDFKRSSGPLQTLYAMGACFIPLVAAPGAHAESAVGDQADSSEPNDKLEQVTVTGVRPLLSDKLPQSQQDVPQSLTVVSSKLVAEQGATRLTDALKNVPGITLNSGEGAARGDTVNLRGFSAFNDFFLDGIRDAAVYTRDSFDLESVEVVKGPSAVLFGRGSTGGAINQVSKAPLLTALNSVTTIVGTNELLRTTADLNMPLSAASAARLDAMDESSEFAGRDFVNNRRWGIAPSLAFGIGEADTLTFAYLHQQEDNAPDSGIPFVNGRPAPVPRDSNYGLVSDSTTTRDDIGTLRYKQDFNSALSIADTVRYAHYEFNYRQTMPNFGANVPAPETPLSDILVGRDAPGSSGIQTNLTEQLDFTARFVTGWLTHTLVAGVEFARQTADLDRYVNPFNSNNSWIPETPLLAADPNEPLPGIQPVSSQQDTTAHSQAAYLTDTIGMGRYFDLLAGARYDRFAADYQQLTVAGGAVLDLDHTDRLGSPRAALLFTPTPVQTYYLSYGTSFDPSAEALTLTTKTADLGPVKAKTYEAGAKTTWLDGGLLVTGAVFRTEVDNAQTNDPENPTLTTLNGNQRVTGAELGISGYITRAWEVFGGYTFLDGRTIESGTAAYVGKQLPNAARNALNLWTEYEFPHGWEVGGGLNWLGQRYADSGNTASIPGYVVWNAMVAYQVSPTFSLQLNGLNLFNRYYFDAPYYTSAAENHVIPGAGRSAMLTAHIQF